MGRWKNQPAGKNHAVQQRRGGAMNTLFKTAALSVLAVACAMLMGCESITDIGKPIAPIDLMWTKGPGSHVEVDLALRDCGRKIQQNTELMRGTAKARSDFNDICMLQKGFKFVPKPEGWANRCNSQMFPDSIACKSVRGEYQLSTPGETR
jgi:hypothetical protein